MENQQLQNGKWVELKPIEFQEGLFWRIIKFPKRFIKKLLF